jgi:hypothetical protein
MAELPKLGKCQYCESLCDILIETVHTMIMYPHHRSYVRDVILHEKPDITPREISGRMGIPLGEALVILYELREEEKATK